MRRLATSLVVVVVVVLKKKTLILLILLQVERQSHGRESNRQPLRVVWVSLHYHLVVQGHLGPHIGCYHKVVVTV